MRYLFLALSYLLGSLPTGYIAFRLSGGADIRQYGSRSTGATNVFRVGGPMLALPVLVVDVLKGFFPVWLAVRLFHDPALAACCGFVAVVGHCYPFTIRFRGGKGVATALGAFIALGWAPLLVSVAVFLLAVGITRYVSLGSILAAAAYPLSLLFAFHGPRAVVLWSLAVSILIIIRHKTNVRRLLSGSERKLGEKTS